jgi:hypothetical protein
MPGEPRRTAEQIRSDILAERAKLDARLAAYPLTPAPHPRSMLHG